NIDATIDVQESATFLDNRGSGKLDGIMIVGWGADYPDITDFLDVHFGTGAGKKFGKSLDDIAAALTKGGSTPDDAARTAAYTEANNLIRQHVPMVPVAHGGNATAWKADVQGAHSSPLTVEQLFAVTPGTRQQIVFMQNAEPNSVDCTDETDGETIRACAQVMQSLYGFKTGVAETIPVLATECKPNADLTVWTCTLRDNVKFADGSALDANDVVVSFARQWDTKHPLHKGRTSVFEFFASLFGGYLNPPPP